MPAKITLVTPPDIFENQQFSLLFIDIDQTDQDTVVDFFKNVDADLNLYFYNGENNVPWLFYALARSDYTFINIDNMSAITSYISGYILSKQGVFYKCQDINITEIYNHINLNKVNNIKDFLEKVYSV